MKLRLYIDGLFYDEEPVATQIDMFEMICYWHNKYQLKRKMRFEIFMILPSKMNTTTNYETTNID